MNFLSKSLLNSLRCQCQRPYSFHHINENASPIVKKLLNGLYNGQRGSLAQAITLMETTNVKKQILAKEMLSYLFSNSHNRFKSQGVSGLSFRIGLSGPPGAGKSTFIETFGKFLTSKNMKVAVLAIDPSSAKTGGSLLGDKTRMPELTKDSNAYIRGSPARGHLGGVTFSTNEAIIVCEEAGYDIIIIETVGVGQSEFEVVDMVDMFALILPPGGGDELQGIKRGIMEMSDLIVINKSDGDLVPAAQRIQYEYISALKYIRPKYSDWKTPVKRVSSINGDGVKALWDIMLKFRNLRENNGSYLKLRQMQQRKLMWAKLNNNLMNIIRTLPDVSETSDRLEREVIENKISPYVAAEELLDILIMKLKEHE